MEWVNAVVQGILIGGLYALFAAGLSLIFGVMRLVNIAHGDLIVAAAYLAWVIIQATGLNPLASLIFVLPIAALAGYGLQMGIFNRVLGRDILPPLLVSFGLSVIIQNGLLAIFTVDSHKLNAGALETGSFEILPDVSIGYFPFLMFVTAVGVIFALHTIFYRTALGRAFRATSDDAEVASLMGLDNRRVYAWAMALCLAIVALAGVFLAIRSNFDPFMGPSRLIFGFEAVIIGGLGNLWGTLVGGVILGVAQGLGAEMNPGWQVLAGHVAFLLVLAFRPRGLFPKLVG
jgi:branched-chain amino acid transport system permease protein